MNLAKIIASGFASVVLTSLVACGGGSGASAYEPSEPEAPVDTSSAGPAFGKGKPTVSAELGSCATASATATPKPVYLVFAYDQSGSMSFDGKWAAAGASMKGFFASPAAAGIHASMTLFPKYDAYPAFCNVSEYTSPDVAVQTLPSATFGTALDATGPQANKGGTPTMAALTGAMTYAAQLQAGVAKDATVAVVMVTDGVPEICTDKGDVGPAAKVASDNASKIPTYVVGVGPDLANLNTIAAAGGTKQAFMVSVGDPKKTQTELTNAINAIKVSTLSCEYDIPKAPKGETIDPAKLNVQYTPIAGAPETLSYDADCKSGTGFRYDDAKNPTKVVACDTTCNEIKNVGGKIDMVFGCAAHVAPVAPVK
jgi:hypothetical protein